MQLQVEMFGKVVVGVLPPGLVQAGGVNARSPDVFGNGADDLRGLTLA